MNRKDDLNNTKKSEDKKKRKKVKRPSSRPKSGVIRYIKTTKKEFGKYISTAEVNKYISKYIDRKTHKPKRRNIKRNISKFISKQISSRKIKKKNIEYINVIDQVPERKKKGKRNRTVNYVYNNVFEKNIPFLDWYNDLVEKYTAKQEKEKNIYSRYMKKRVNVDNIFIIRLIYYVNDVVDRKNKDNYRIVTMIDKFRSLYFAYRIIKEGGHYDMKEGYIYSLSVAKKECLYW